MTGNRGYSCEKKIFPKKINLSLNNSYLYLLLFLWKKKKTAGIYCSQRRLKFSLFSTVMANSLDSGSFYRKVILLNFFDRTPFDRNTI
jgi:hypothetical protein